MRALQNCVRSVFSCTTILFLANIAFTQQPGTITTVAGNGDRGYYGDGGLATAAALNGPYGVAVDASGNLYIADSRNNVIRKVTPDGVITTVAGNGSFGFSGDGGPATSATLSRPQGITVDLAGNLYVADTVNNRIRKVTSGGIISTVAGSGSVSVPYIGFSGDGGPATSASLFAPYGVAVDPSGNLYFAETGADRVRKVTTEGIISTVAGNVDFSFPNFHFPDEAPSLWHPSGVAVQASGDIYIADTDNRRIQKVAPDGVISTVAGTGNSSVSDIGDGGPATAASLWYPSGVALDPQGNLYIADTGGHRVRKVTPAGVISTIAGTGEQGFGGDGGPAERAVLGVFYGVAVDTMRNLYIADTDNNRIRKVSLPPEPLCIPPSISNQPQSLTIATGGKAALNVSAEGTGLLTYQWYRGHPPPILGPFALAPVGSNSPSYTTEALTSTTSYWVRVTNGCGSVDSAESTITILPEVSKPLVVIIPGIYGTKLISQGGTAWLSFRQIIKAFVNKNPDDKTEVANQVDAFADLQYTDDGQPSNRDVHPQDLMNLRNNLLKPLDSLDCAEASLAFAAATLALSQSAFAALKSAYLTNNYCQEKTGIYNSLVARLNSAGFETHTFPYDWRESYGPTAANPNENPAARLYEIVKKLGTPSRPVAIVAHSMGGLVSGEMLRLNTQRGGELTPILGPIITLGTPFDGSLEAYTNLQGWGKIAAPFMSNPASFEIGKHWTSAYDLLPRWGFLRGSENGEPFSIFRQGHQTRYPLLPRWHAIEDDIRTLWSKHDERYPKAYAVIGTGFLTPTYLDADDYEVTYTNGDGTVPVTSGETAGWVPPGNFLYVKEEHVALPRNTAVLDAVEAILSGGGQPLTLPKKPFDAPEPVKIRLTGTAPAQGAKLTRRHANGSGTNCPLEMMVKDSSGRAVGGGLDNLSGAGMLSFGCEVLVWAPKGIEYTVELTGASPGQAELLVDTTASTQTSWQRLSFQGIVSTPQSKGTLTIGPDGSTSALQFDATGSGFTQVMMPMVVGGGAIPQITPAGVTNGASFVGGTVAPGIIATVFGSGLTTNLTGIVQAESIPLPTVLSGTSVLVDGRLAPLFAIANVNGLEQVNFQVPWEVAGKESVTVVVSNQGISGNAVQVNLAPAQPGVFMFGENSGVIVHGVSNQLVTASNPARPGEVVVVYATGLGAVSPASGTGVASAPTEPFSRTDSTPIVTIGGRHAEVQFSGLTPGFVGLYQINAQIPSDIGSGNLDVLVSVGNQTSKEVKLAVAQ